MTTTHTTSWIIPLTHQFAAAFVTPLKSFIVWISNP